MTLPIEHVAAALAEMSAAERLASMLPLEGQMFLRLLLALPPKARAPAPRATGCARYGKEGEHGTLCCDAAFLRE